MSKKSIIISIIVAVLLLAGIAVAVVFLYSDVPSGSHSRTGDAREAADVRKASSDLLKAVPTDAAAVAAISDKDAAEFLLPKEVSIPDSLAHSRRVVVSLHNSGSLTPLFITDAGADSVGLASPSETIMRSSRRHIEDGRSLLDDGQFASLYAQMSDRNTLYFSNNYAAKILSSYCGRQYTKFANAIKSLGSWTGLHVKENDARHIVLQGQVVCGQSAADYMNVLKDQGTGDAKLTEMLPSTTVYAISIQVSDFQKYCDAYRRFLDASQKLNTSKFSEPEAWGQKAGIKEIATFVWKTEQGEDAQAVIVRTAKDVEMQADYIPVLFGELFTLPGEVETRRQDNWTILASQSALDDLMLAYEDSDLLSDESSAMIVTYSRSAFNVEKLKGAPRAARQSASVAAASVEIPQGPFPVHNSGTGKVNLFYQNEALSLCLKEEGGKGIWGVPFKTPICGAVEEVDYYNNGRIQFVFASTSKLYMMDRLGRFVNGFPVDLGKEVLLGPKIYDFSGAKAYRALVLHTDNTIGMYNLHGQFPEGWKGIAPEEPVTGLPELADYQGKKYWKVPTASRFLVYELMGGDEVKEKKVLNNLK